MVSRDSAKAFSRFIRSGVFFLLATAFFLFALSPLLGPTASGFLESVLPWNPHFFDSFAAAGIGMVCSLFGVQGVMKAGSIRNDREEKFAGLTLVLFGCVLGGIIGVTTTYLFMSGQERTEIEQLTLLLQECTDAYTEVRDELQELTPSDDRVPVGWD